MAEPVSGAQGPPPGFATVIPQPLAQAPERGAFVLQPSARIVVRSTAPEATRVAQLIARSLRPATGYRLPVVERAGRRARRQHHARAHPRRPCARRRGIPPRRDARGRRADRRTAGGAVLRRSDAAPAPARGNRGGRAAAGPVADRARHDPRPPALRLARRDARRRAALPRGRRGRAAHRPDGALQAQPAAPPPLRRSGLADLDPLVAAPCDRRRPIGGRRREGRVLHPARLRADRRVRARPVRRRRARDRHAGARQRRPLGLRDAHLQRRRSGAPDGHGGGLQLALHRQGADLPVRQRRDPRGRGPHARPLRPRRRRRGALDPPRGLPRLHGAGRVDRPLPREADDRLGGGCEDEASSHLGRPALARPRARPPGGGAGREGRDVAGAEGLPRHEVHAGLADRAHLGGNDLRAGRVLVGSGDAGPGCPRARHPRGRGAALDGDGRDARRRRLPDVPAPARAGRDRLVARRRPDVAALQVASGDARAAPAGARCRVLRLARGAVEKQLTPAR